MLLKSPRSITKQLTNPRHAKSRLAAKKAIKMGQRHARTPGKPQGDGYRNNYLLAAKHHLARARFGS